MQIPLLRDIFVILALAVAVAMVCHRLRIPTVVGLLITGVIAGPHGLGLVRDVHEIEVLAEIGVIFLLFTIGIEFSLSSLRRIWKLFLIGGSLQVSITAVGGMLLFRYLGADMAQAVLAGCAVALSSTAIVLKLLQNRFEIAAPHGRLVLGVLIFQDVAVVLMMLAVPILSDPSASSLGRQLALLAAKGAAIGGITWVLASFVVPRLFTQIARTGSSELFLLAVGLVCFAVAWFTSLLGLSLALGAFIAGLIISESEFSHRALGSAIPFRDTFTSFFFVSVGMLLDLGYVIDAGPRLLAIIGAVLLLKLAAGGVAGLILGMPFRVAALAAVVLAQVGEFSLVLLTQGRVHGIIDSDGFQMLLAIAIVTMVLTPFLIVGSHRIADAAARVPMPAAVRAGRHFMQTPADDDELRDHMVIVGYGVIGSTLAQSAQLLGIPYVIVEINYETVRNLRRKGENIFYGDATQEASLEKAGIARARVLAISIPDAPGVRRTVELARRLNPSTKIVARARYVQETEPLYRLGADEIVSEELEASIEMFSAVMHEFGVPADRIEEFGGRARTRHYEVLREMEPPKDDRS